MIWIALLALTLILPGCGDKTGGKSEPANQHTGPNPPLRDYFFPVDKLSSPRKYFFTSAEAGISFHWELRRIEENGKVFLETRDHDAKGNLSQVFREEITENAALLVSSTVYELDSLSGKYISSPCNIEENISYNWASQGSTVAKFRFSWISPPTGNGTLEVDKTRVFDRFEKVNVSGKDYECALFNEQVITSFTSPSGERNEYQFSQVVYYAKDVGLVRFIRDLTRGREDYVLTMITE